MNKFLILSLAVMSASVNAERVETWHVNRGTDTFTGQPLNMGMTTSFDGESIVLGFKCIKDNYAVILLANHKIFPEEKTKKLAVDYKIDDTYGNAEIITFDGRTGQLFGAGLVDKGVDFSGKNLEKLIKQMDKGNSFRIRYESWTGRTISSAFSLKGFAKMHKAVKETCPNVNY